MPAQPRPKTKPSGRKSSKPAVGDSPWGVFSLTVLCVWAVAGAAAYFYAQQRGIAWGPASSLLPAFLLEAAFYTALGMERVRGRLERVDAANLGGLLWIAAVAPFIFAGLGFDLRRLAAVAALAAVASFWYALLPPRPAVDLLYLAVLAAAILGKAFAPLYPSPVEKLPLDILGHLMWIRTAAFALLCQRKVRGVGFGFLPQWRDWRIGAAYAAAFVPIAAALAFWLNVMTLRWPAHPWWKTALLAAGTFAGILWVVALSEEFLFRGLLQQWLGEWLRNDFAGLLAASILFGAVHLGFRGFPNWRFSILAGLLGLFCGMAFRTAKSIRASMVLHALVVTFWRTFGG